MSSELQAFYRSALPARIAALRGACAAFTGGEPGAEATLRQLAHTIRGSGGTYGFPHISAAAAALEDAQPEALRQRVDELIAILHAEANPS